MSAITTAKPPDNIWDIEEPSYYGFRHVRRTLPDGREVLENVPLTREDVLHPQEGDAIMQGDPHDNDRIYLKNVFKRVLAGDANAKVFADMGVDLNLPGVPPYCPDITVIFGIPPLERLWSLYRVAEFGIRPWLLIEVTSPSTRSVDLRDKLDDYHRGQVPFFLIADAVVKNEVRYMRVLGYRDTSEGYVEWQPDERGWFWLDRLGLWLGTDRGRVVCYDVHGQEIGDYVTVSQSLDAAEARALQESRARALAEARAKEEAQARTLADVRAKEEAQARALAEARAKEEAQARSLAETLAKEEAQARAAAERRLRQLEEKLRRLELPDDTNQP